MRLDFRNRCCTVAIVLLGVAAAACGSETTAAGGTGGGTTNCDAVCEKHVECVAGGLVAVCQSACDVAVDRISAISMTCANALDAALGCAGSLSCPEYEDWENEEPPDAYPCREETEACDAACDSFCGEELEL